MVLQAICPIRDSNRRGALPRCGAVRHQYRHRNTHTQCLASYLKAGTWRVQILAFFQIHEISGVLILAILNWFVTKYVHV